MKNIMNKSINLKKWYFVDVKNKILGRVATKITRYLMGKHKPEYKPNIDTGDYIIVLNSEKIIVTGNKYKNKIYYNYSGYIGGMKKKSFEEMMIRDSRKIIKLAIKRMLPKGPLGNLMYKKLKVFKDENHLHIAQKPKFLDI